MPTYTVHEPPPRKSEAVPAPESFVFVRDGFYVWAFLLAPLWLLRRRLWLALAIYLLVNVALGICLTLIGAPPGMSFLVSLLIALLVGFEASTIWRQKLTWHKWKTLGFVVGDDVETAERRFYAAWVKHADQNQIVTSAAPAPQYSAPVRRGPPSPSDVMGLFPEPEA